MRRLKSANRLKTVFLTFDIHPAEHRLAKVLLWLLTAVPQQVAEMTRISARTFLTPFGGARRARSGVSDGGDSDDRLALALLLLPTQY